MKIAFLADLHLNTATYGGADKDGITFRTKDFMSAFSWSVTKITKEIKPDAVFILGDIYDNAHPSNNVRRFFNSQIKKLNSAGIAVHILVGNHDSCKLNHALEPLIGMAIPNVFVYYSPETVDIENGPVVFVFPHSQEVERQEIGMRESFIATAKEWHDVAKKAEENGRESILLGHFPILGAKVSDDSACRDEEHITPDDIDLVSSSYGFFGDFHGVQKLNCKTDAMYVGSLERSTFNDIDGKKGFAVYNSDGVESPFIGKNVEFVEYPNVRPMFELSGDWDSLSPKIDLLEKTAKEAIVKISFHGDKSQFLQFEKEKDSVKKKIRSFGAKIILISETIKDDEREEAVKRIQLDLKKMDDVESNDIDQVVQAALKSNSENPEDIKEVLSIAYDIMRSVKNRIQNDTGVLHTGTVRIHGVRGHNFQRFGEEDNVVEFDKGAKYFLSTGVDGFQQWQREDFHRKGKKFLDQILKDKSKKILSIIGMIDGNQSKSNGAGKSTTIEMISYAFYEKRTREYVHKFSDREKGKSTTSIMREKNGKIECQEAFSEILFSVDKSLWLLRRGRRLQGKDGSKHESILDVYCITSDGFVYSEGSHAGHRGEDANKTISGLIKMPFETFCNSLLFGQNDAGQFLVGTDKTRKEIIINILQLGILNDYLEETRKRKREVENEMVSLRAQSEVLLDGIDQKEGELKAKVSGLEKEISSLESEVEEVKRKISSFNLSDYIAEHEQAKAFLEACENEIKLKSKEMERDLADVNSRIENCKTDIIGFEKRIKQTQKRLDEDANLLSTCQKTVKEHPEDKIKSQQELIAAAKKSKPDRDAQKTKLTEKLSKLLPTYGELSGSIKERNEELDALKALKKKCENGVKIKCSKCRQLVGIGHIEAEIIRVTSEISAKQSSLEEVENEKASIEKELGDVETRLGNIEKFLRKESELLTVQHQYESAKGRINELESRISESQTEIKTTSESMLRVVDDKNRLQTEWESLFKNKKKALSPYEEKKEKAAAAVKEKKGRLDGIKSEMNRLEEEQKRLSSNIGDKRSAKVRAETGIESVKESREKAKAIADKINDGMHMTDLYKTLDWVFGQDGAQVYIIEKYMPLLNHYLQDFLDVISDRTIKACVVTDGKREGKVELAISGEMSSTSDGASGGESVKLRLALDMALGMLSLTRVNGSIDSIYIDEAIAPVDIDSKERIFELLNKLQEHFRTVVIVSHDQSVQEKIKDTIVIDKVNGISKVKKQYYEPFPVEV